jgi:nicotinamide riboside kinase
VYNEDIVITGSKGSGKSYLANTFLQNLHGVNVFVWDFNHAFHDSRSIVFHHLDEMIEMFDEVKRGKYILQDYNKEENQFKRFCKYAFKKAIVVCND